MPVGRLSVPPRLTAPAACGGKRLSHRGSFARSFATSAFAASCAAVASLNFFISAGVVLPRPIGSAARFIANAERSAAMALWRASVRSSANTSPTVLRQWSRHTVVAEGPTGPQKRRPE